MKETYKLFILYLSITELIMSCSFFSQLIHMIWFNKILCVINGFIFSVSTFCMMASLPLLPLNRYVKLYYSQQYHRISSKRGCGFIRCTVWVICIILTFVFYFAGALGNGLHDSDVIVQCDIYFFPHEWFCSTSYCDCFANCSVTISACNIL